MYFAKKSLSILFSLLPITYYLLLTTSCSSPKSKTWSDSGVWDSKNEKNAEFGREVDLLLKESGFSGAVLFAKGEKIIFAKGYGLCDPHNPKSQDITINTTFEAGSLTKQMTAAAILQLAKKKKLSLEDSLSDYFPEYKNREKITIRMLLNMRSGLTDCINSADEFFPKNIYRHIEINQIKCKPLDENIVLDYLPGAPMLAAPDSTYFYCNTNYFLLAKIIEKVSGLSYQEYIQKNIFDRCGMHDSNLEFQNTDTVGYDYKGRYYSIPAALSQGCGDLNTNVTDLFKWNCAFFKGKVTGKKPLKEISASDSYTYGFYRHDDFVFHSGTTNVFNSYSTYNFSDKTSLIILSNQPVSKLNVVFLAQKIKKIY